MRAARLTNGADVTGEPFVVTVTVDRPTWSPADNDVTAADGGDDGEVDDECVVMTSTDDAGIRRRGGRVDSGLPPPGFDSETPTSVSALGQKGRNVRWPCRVASTNLYWLAVFLALLIKMTTCRVLPLDSGLQRINDGPTNGQTPDRGFTVTAVVARGLRPA